MKSSSEARIAPIVVHLFIKSLEVSLALQLVEGCLQSRTPATEKVAAYVMTMWDNGDSRDNKLVTTLNKHVALICTLLPRAAQGNRRKKVYPIPILYFAICATIGPLSLGYLARVLPTPTL